MPKAVVRPGPPLAVLFDLDGTLVDSAPDLAGAGNEMRTARGLAPLALAHFRPMVGAGARGMVWRALDIGPEHESFAELRDEFLRRYEARMTRETRVFEGINAVIEGLSCRAMPWGIVTNKATRFADPLVRFLGLLDQASTLVCGDTTAHAKPHPEPLYEAARRLKVRPDRCIYVGDDLRDVQAGRAAGMVTVGAGWGYLGSGESIEGWGADHIAPAPQDLLNVLGMA